MFSIFFHGNRIFWVIRERISNVQEVYMNELTTMQQIRFLRRWLYPHWGKMTGLGLLIFASIGLQLIAPRFLQSFIDAAAAGASSAILMKAALFFLAMTMLRQAVTIVVQSLAGHVAWTVANTLRLTLAGKCLRREAAFHNRHTPGELVERIDGDTAKLNHFLSAFMLKAFGNHLLIAALAIAILMIDSVVGLVVIVLSGLSLFALHRLGRYGTSSVRGYMAESAELIGYMDEHISGREDIRALNRLSTTLNGYYVRIKRLYRTRRRTGTALAAVLNAGDMTIALFMAVSILCLGLLMLHDGQLSVGTMFLVYYYVTLLIVPLRNIVGELSELQQAGAALSRIHELLEAEPEPRRQAAVRLDATAALSIAFDHVTFGYEPNVPVIRKLSLHLPANRSVALIGKTGSGKTTIAKLLFGLYEPQQGSISINGIDIRDIEPGSLRASIAFIPQSVDLFEGTLRDNIALFDPRVQDEQIEQTIRKLHMGKWLEQYPQALDKRIERDGRNVSAGEAQLIAFARACVKQPRLVILDEATSRIDPDTELVIGEAMRELMRDRTVIIIAHKLASVESADDVLVMSDGQAIEFGETKALRRQPTSEYAKLRKEAGLLL
jgi:ABC-type multidrug transport system fused ATPase/permease subunit